MTVSSRPWDVDRPLTLEAAREVIASSFPGIDAGMLVHLGSGWEFDAFLTADGWVFRFPRRAESAELFAPEQRVLELVARILPGAVRVPVVEVVGDATPAFPYMFAGHRFIPGIAADEVDPELLPTVAREIAAVLGAIHSIPEQAARAAGVLESVDDEEGGTEWFERGVEGASALRGIDDTVDRSLSWVTEVPWPLPRFVGPLRFIHQDLCPEHLIVEPDTGRLTGILDWTDAILGDPARDFVFLVTWRGWGFAEHVLREYGRPLDEGFRERLHFMARLLAVIWLGIAHEQGSDLGEHIEGVRNAFSNASPW